MELGVTMFTTDQAITPVELARAVEGRGFHLLYVPEPTHIPPSRRTPPPTGEPVLAEEYKRTLDPFVALGAAAAVTSRLRLGTGGCPVPGRAPRLTRNAPPPLHHTWGARPLPPIGSG